MADNNITKNASGGRYKYADMSQIHEWLEKNNITYYQYVDRIDGDDYVMTVPTINGKELPPRRGCRIVDATLVGISNPAQEQGSAITYARRYSLLMAFGLATEDDDAQSLSRKKTNGNNLITPQQKAQILHEVNRTKVSVNQICASYKVESLDDIPGSSFEGLMKSLKAYPDA